MSPDSRRQISLSDAFRVSDDVVFREVGGEAVILDLQHGTYFGLDPVGTRIWQLLEGRADLQHVVETLVTEYDVERATAERDLLDLMDDLRRRELVRPAV